MELHVIEQDKALKFTSVSIFVAHSTSTVIKVLKRIGVTHALMSNIQP